MIIKAAWALTAVAALNAAMVAVRAGALEDVVSAFVFAAIWATWRVYR